MQYDILSYTVTFISYHYISHNITTYHDIIFFDNHDMSYIILFDNHDMSYAI